MLYESRPFKRPNLKGRACTRNLRHFPRRIPVKHQPYFDTFVSCVKMHFHAPAFQYQTSVWRSVTSKGLPCNTPDVWTFVVTTAVFPYKRTLGSDVENVLRVR